MIHETPSLEIQEIQEISDKKCIKAALTGRLLSRVDMRPLDKFFQDSRKNGVINFIFDLSDVSFICSTGLSKFAQYLKEVKEEGGKIIVYGTPKEVKHIIQLVNLHDRLNSCETFEDALKKL